MSQSPARSVPLNQVGLWCCLSLIVVVLTACHGQGHGEEVHRADAKLAATRAIAHVENQGSPNGYQVEMTCCGENKVIDVVPSYRLTAFGGQLMGDDRGEFGGELVFSDQRGLVHQVLKENVHGIFQMPFGVVIFTGVAHLSFNFGQIYLVTASSGGVPVAGSFCVLPGAPEQVVRALSGDLLFKVFNGHFEKNEDGYKVPVKDCYRMTKSGDVEKLACTSIVIVN